MYMFASISIRQCVSLSVFLTYKGWGKHMYIRSMIMWMFIWACEGVCVNVRVYMRARVHMGVFVCMDKSCFLNEWDYSCVCVCVCKCIRAWVRIRFIYIPKIMKFQIRTTGNIWGYCGLCVCSCVHYRGQVSEQLSERLPLSEMLQIERTSKLRPKRNIYFAPILP